MASSLGAGAGITGDIKLFKILDERKTKDQTTNQVVVTCCSSVKRKKVEEASTV
jgi:hypothetical protein